MIGYSLLSPYKNTHSQSCEQMCCIFTKSVHPPPAPSEIKGLSMIFALKFSWRTRQSNGKEGIAYATDTAWHLPYSGRKERLSDCFSTSACLPFCGSAETQGQDTVGLPQFPLPCAANTDPVAKPSLVDGLQCHSLKSASSFVRF